MENPEARQIREKIEKQFKNTGQKAELDYLVYAYEGNKLKRLKFEGTFNLLRRLEFEINFDRDDKATIIGMNGIFPISELIDILKNLDEALS